MKQKVSMIFRSICRFINRMDKSILIPVVFAVLVFCKSIYFNDLIEVPTGSTLMFACAGTGFVLAAFSFWFGGKGKLWYCLAMDIVISVIMVADIVYYRYYNTVLSIPVLMQASVVDSSLTQSIVSLIHPQDILFLLDALLALVLLRWILPLLRSQRRRAIWKRALQFLCTGAIGGMLIFSGFYFLVQSMGAITLRVVYDQSTFVYSVGVLNYHAFDIGRFLTNSYNAKAVSIPTSEKEQVKLQLEVKKTEADAQRSAQYGIGKGRNLIVIQVEAMQNFVIHREVNGQEITPNLNRLIEDSYYFDHYFSLIGQGNTSDAEFITNNSFYAVPQGATYFTIPSNQFASLGTLLKKQGYSTMAMHAYKASYWNRAVIYPALGFDKFFSGRDFTKGKQVGWGCGDEDFFLQGIEYMKQSTKPFYSFMVTLSSHFPYDALSKHDGIDVGKYDGTFLGNYFKAMNYVDHSIGELIRVLKQEGLYDNTVIAIYGDHEGLKKDQYPVLRELMDLPDNDEVTYRCMKNIPLIIHVPGTNAKGVISKAGGQVDLLPTVADILGLDYKYAMGRNLLTTQESFAIFRDGCVTDGKKLYFKPDKKVYDMVTGEETEAGELQKHIDAAPAALSLSDKVLQNNLIKYFNQQD